MLEMYRRDHYREELVFEQCAELVELEERILELDALVSAAVVRPLAARRGPLRLRRAARPRRPLLRQLRPARRRPARRLPGVRPSARRRRALLRRLRHVGARRPARLELEATRERRHRGALEPDVEGSASTADPWER